MKPSSLRHVPFIPRLANMSTGAKTAATVAATTRSNAATTKVATDRRPPLSCA